MIMATYLNEKRTRKDGGIVQSSVTGAVFKRVDVWVDYPREFSVHARLTKAPFARARVEVTASRLVYGGTIVLGEIEKTKLPTPYDLVVDAIAIPPAQSGSKDTVGIVKKAILNAVSEVLGTYLEIPPG